jgi:hypothetical protein
LLYVYLRVEGQAVRAKAVVEVDGQRAAELVSSKQGSNVYCEFRKLKVAPGRHRVVNYPALDSSELWAPGNRPIKLDLDVEGGSANFVEMLVSKETIDATGSEKIRTRRRIILRDAAVALERIGECHEG